MENKNAKLEVYVRNRNSDSDSEGRVTVNLNYSQNQTSYFSVKKDQDFNFNVNDIESKRLAQKRVLEFIKSINHDLNIDLEKLTIDNAQLDISALKNSDGIEKYIDFLKHIKDEDTKTQTLYFVFRGTDLYFTWSKELTDGNNNEIRFDFSDDTSNTVIFQALIYFLNLF